MKKKKTWPLLALAAIFGMCIGAWIAIGWPNRAKGIQIDHEAIMVRDTAGRKTRLVDLLSIDTDRPVYCLFASVFDCGSCMAKGLGDLSELRKSGETCRLIVIGDDMENARHTLRSHPGQDWYFLHKKDFIAHVQVTTMPILLVFQRGKIINHRYFQ